MGKDLKDRYTLLSTTSLNDLRTYYIQWKPSVYLFESPNIGKYSPNSVGQIVTSAALKAGIKKHVSTYTETLFCHTSSRIGH